LIAFFQSACAPVIELDAFGVRKFRLRAGKLGSTVLSFEDKGDSTCADITISWLLDRVSS